MSKPLLFEHPLNERTRTLLRLSRLFGQLEQQLAGESVWHSRGAVQALVDILAILARADLKTEFIKQLDQHTQALQRVAERPDVDQERLQRVLEDLDRTATRLHGVHGQLGQPLRNHEFLSGIAQRLTIPGGSFEFDLPQFHHWLHRPPEERAEQLREWRRQLGLVEEMVELLLGLLRHSNVFRRQQAPGGLFQKSLDPDRPVEMVQLRLDPALGLFPEISGSKHRICIRFLEAGQWQNPAASAIDVPFSLKTCVL